MKKGKEEEEEEEEEGGTDRKHSVCVSSGSGRRIQILRFIVDTLQTSLRVSEGVRSIGSLETHGIA